MDFYRNRCSFKITIINVLTQNVHPYCTCRCTWFYVRNFKDFLVKIVFAERELLIQFFLSLLLNFYQYYMFILKLCYFSWTVSFQFFYISFKLFSKKDGISWNFIHIGACCFCFRLWCQATLVMWFLSAWLLTLLTQ